MILKIYYFLEALFELLWELTQKFAKWACDPNREIFHVTAICFVLAAFWLGLKLPDDGENVRWFSCTRADSCLFTVGNSYTGFKHLNLQFVGVEAPKENGDCPQEGYQAKAALNFTHSAFKAAKEIKIRKIRQTGVSNRREIKGTGQVMVDGYDLSILLIRQGYGRAYDHETKKVIGNKWRRWCPKIKIKAY